LPVPQRRDSGVVRGTERDPVRLRVASALGERVDVVDLEPLGHGAALAVD
jgi:hypothetical protein